MGKAVFQVTCPEIGFTRGGEIPIDARGYAHKLAEDLAEAMDIYQIRVELHLVKQALQGLVKLKNHKALYGDDESYRNLKPIMWANAFKAAGVEEVSSQGEQKDGR